MLDKATDGGVLRLLRALALRGGLSRPVKATTTELSHQLGVSQQSVSLWMRKAASDGLIGFEPAGRTRTVRLTEDGVDLLRREYLTYRTIFEDQSSEMVFDGKLVTGIGEGSYYIGLDGYKDQLEKVLGFEPRFGTLNLQIKPEDKAMKACLLEFPGFTIEGFEMEDRSFGEGTCYKAEIAGIACGVMIPSRSHYSDVLEVVSHECLRKALKINDGDTVQLKVFLS